MKIFKARHDNPRKYIAYTMNRRFPVTLSNPSFNCARSEDDIENEVRWLVYREIKYQRLLDEMPDLQ